MIYWITYSCSSNFSNHFTFYNLTITYFIKIKIYTYTYKIFTITPLLWIKTLKKLNKKKNVKITKCFHGGGNKSMVWGEIKMGWVVRYDICESSLMKQTHLFIFINMFNHSFSWPKLWKVTPHGSSRDGEYQSFMLTTRIWVMLDEADTIRGFSQNSSN